MNHLNHESFIDLHRCWNYWKPAVMLDKPGTCFPRVMGSSLQNRSVFNPIRKTERSRKEDKTKKNGIYSSSLPFRLFSPPFLILSCSKWKTEKKYFVSMLHLFLLLTLTDRYNPCCSKWCKSWYNVYVTVLIWNTPRVTFRWLMYLLMICCIHQNNPRNLGISTKGSSKL